MKMQCGDQNLIDDIMEGVPRFCFGPGYDDFDEKYGVVEQLMMECPQGRDFFEEHRPWYEYKPRARTYTELPSFEDKFWIDQKNYDGYDIFEGEWAASGGCDGLIFLWPIDTQHGGPPCVRFANVHPQVLADFQFDWKHMKSVSVGCDCRLVIYDYYEDKIVGTIKNNTGVHIHESWYSQDADFAAGKVAVGAAKGQIKIGDLETCKLLWSGRVQEDSIYGMQADWDLNQVVSASFVAVLFVSTCAAAR